MSKPAAASPTGGSSGRSGRRPGRSDSRERILAAARTCFGDAGFTGTTMRGVAARAAVDPALVHYYFGSKQRLFVAAMEFSVDFDRVVPQLLAGPPQELGYRLARFALETWSAPRTRAFLPGLVRSVASDPVAASLLRQTIAEGPIAAIARAIDRPDASLRAALAGSQLVGLAMARFVVGVEPLASATDEAVARAVGPTIQRYLTGDLG